MKFARYTFLIAGIYGLLVLIPQYFLESKNAVDFPPPLTHPEYFYGFVGVAVAFQFVFLIISRDPARYRPLMIASVIEKFSFAISTIVLYSFGRIYAAVLGFGLIDLLLGVLFVIAYVLTKDSYRSETN
ncbi:MAG: hypothetical protein DWQ47_07630 [Acidobacteria bacterium]|nr:MAG: hypothetical protein DWQ32_15730 [Acidobacteriota bacterium]REJ99209.1 MAG: hypothetical protein DWQ38_14245 [Acidobacteriota bacterium]REK16070.1 MAG: hypothetical protein DWQ43_03440 [Acidobacteriota bacterium]REK43751.1 MAG: hypothetical protein DWQ47_07630 [Acidobacteriota bacterium]